MAGHKTYEESIKDVYKGLVLLAVVTLVEVAISLLGKGHLGIDVSGYTWILVLIGLGLIVLSLYKAYFIIYEFMHMRYEVKGLAMSVLLPTLLLVWAVIAFFQEGDSWKKRRDDVKQRENVDPNAPSSTQEGYVIPEDTYLLKLG
ncbi:MAG: cytochrome C oxidase subunit IV family protein [Bacteroidota bacterium]